MPRLDPIAVNSRDDGLDDAVMLTVVNALLLTMADGDEPHVGWFRVGGDGRITSMGRGAPALAPASGDVLDASGKIVAPGFLSAHSHLFTSGMRGLASASTLYPWLAANADFLLGADSEDMYWATLHGCLDFLGNGITSAYDFAHGRVAARYDANVGAYVEAYVRPAEFVTRQIDAAAASGLRTMTSLKVEYDRLGRDGALADFEELAAEVRARVPADRTLGVSVYGTVQWADSPVVAELEAELMSAHGITNQAHFVESPEHLDHQREKFDWYLKAGALGPRMLFGHFVHPTDEMVDAVADSGAGMVWQPTSNGRLGSGIADIPRFRARGIPIGVGLDDQSCTDISDPFQNLRIAMYTLRARASDASVLVPRDALRMHTLGSAEVLGVADRVGSLEVGKYADFLVVDPRTPDTGPVWDAYATYALACGLRNLERVYVGGRCVNDRGRSLNSAADDAVAEVHERFARIARDRRLPPPVLP
jgi:cytosine/adenosine deaminase-related metal-dependent hydrolase